MTAPDAAMPAIWRPSPRGAMRAVTALSAAAQTLATCLANLAEMDRPAAIGRKVAAIAVAHRDAGLESLMLIEHGMVKPTLAEIWRKQGTARI